jgi:hypothetical protein
MYALITTAGGWFFYASAFAGAEVAYKTLVQSLIMLLIGGGGLTITLLPRHVGETTHDVQ